jgi:hypothetical protein
LTTEIVSFRIKKELKELARRHEIDISKIAREKVEEELERLQSKERKQTLEKAADVLEKVTREEIVNAVRKSRDSR